MTEAVLVTGATGFIGKRLVAGLHALNVQVLCHSRSTGDIAAAPLNYEGITHVYHLAAETKVPESWSRTSEFYRTNVLGTVNVLELCRRTGASPYTVQFLRVRAAAVAARDGKHPTSAFNPYSHTKILAEDVCRYYGAQFGIGISMIRPFNIYGPGQDPHFLVPMLVRQAADPALQAFRVLDARPRRDFLYVDDLVDLLLRMRNKSGIAIYNAGNGYSHSIRDIVDILNSFRPLPLPLIDEGQERPSEVMDVVADISAVGELGWRPVVKLREGLGRMFEDTVGKAPEGQQ